MQMVAHRRRSAPAKRMRLGLLGLTAAALAVLFVVAVPGTFGAFSAQTTNPNNSFTAGTLTMANSKGGNPIVTVSSPPGMEPGDPATVGTVLITNSGSLKSTMSVTEDTITHGGLSVGDLSSELQLVILDCGSDPSCATSPLTVYTGNFNAVGTKSLTGGGPGGKWNAGEAHTFQFSVSLPIGADNTYQGNSASAEFTWNGAQ